jgi:hypothetical protein
MTEEKENEYQRKIENLSFALSNIRKMSKETPNDGEFAIKVRRFLEATK